MLRLAGGATSALPLAAHLSVRVLAFTAAIAVVTAILFGLMPALRATRVQLAGALRGAGRGTTGAAGSGGRTFTLGKLLVVAQVALSILVLVGSGMLVRSTQRLLDADVGMARDELLVASVDLSRAGYSGARQVAFMRELVLRLGRVPGVRDVSMSENGLFSGTESGTWLQAEGFTATADGDTLAAYDDVLPGYFRTIGAHVLQGRDFEERDNESGARVAIVNRTMAEFYFPNGDAIGRHIRADSTSYEIVGIVGDVIDHDVRGARDRRLYVPMFQLSELPPQVKIEVRVTGSPARLVTPLREALRDADASLVVLSLDPLTDLVRDSVRQDRMLAQVVSAFAILALILAALGLYGVMAYATSRRIGEFGLRAALGAEPGAIARMVLRESVTVVVVGVAAGSTTRAAGDAVAQEPAVRHWGRRPAVAGDLDRGARGERDPRRLPAGTSGVAGGTARGAQGRLSGDQPRVVDRAGRRVAVPHERSSQPNRADRCPPLAVRGGRRSTSHPGIAGRRAYAELRAVRPATERTPRAPMRYALRSLLRTPAYTIVVVLTLALGIGANAAIFTVVNAVLLRPLGYADPDRLVFLERDNSTTVDPATFLDWKEETRSFAQMAVAEYWTPSLAGTGTPVEVPALHVSGEMFSMLGVRPTMGRTFGEAEAHFGSDHVVVVSQAFWKTHLGGDPGVLQRSIRLDGESYAIVGVMPANFVFAPFWATSATIWAPLVLDARRSDRGGSSLRPFARLAAGVTLASARAELQDVSARIDARLGEPQRVLMAIPLRDKVVGDIRDKLYILLASVAFVLLITCANVAHLQLMRGSAREREFGVRMALGASPGRLSRQSLLESVVLALAGAALGLVLVIVGVRLLVAFGPPDIPRLAGISVDWTVVAYLLSAALLSAVAFGLVPSIAAARTSIGRLMQDGGRGGSEGAQRRRTRSAMVVSEFAIAVVLLAGAGLVVRSFAVLTSLDPGFDPHNVATMVVSVKGTDRGAPVARAAFYRDLLARVAELPGVTSASAINHLPLHGDNWTLTYAAEGESYPDDASMPHAVFRVVHPGYFRTMRIRMIRGREYAGAEVAAASRPVIVNARMAERRWPGRDPIGRRIAVPGVGDPGEWFTVVGVSADAKQGEWTADEKEEMYFLSAEHLVSDGRVTTLNPQRMTLVVRTENSASGITAPVEREIARLAPGATVSDVITVEQAIGEQIATPRFYALLMSAFALVALLLAAVGVYGVISYTVSRRAREMGIRIALGAGRAGAFRLIMRRTGNARFHPAGEPCEGERGRAPAHGRLLRGQSRPAAADPRAGGPGPPGCRRLRHGVSRIDRAIGPARRRGDGGGRVGAGDVARRRPRGKPRLRGWILETLRPRAGAAEHVRLRGGPRRPRGVGEGVREIRAAGAGGGPRRPRKDRPEASPRASPIRRARRSAALRSRRLPDPEGTPCPSLSPRSRHRKDPPAEVVAMNRRAPVHRPSPSAGRSVWRWEDGSRRGSPRRLRGCSRRARAGRRCRGARPPA